MSQHQEKPETDVIKLLENESYLKPEFNLTFKDEVKTKIEEFSNWFNSTARLYLLRCPPEESEALIYLLLNLKKKVKFAISEINRSASNSKWSFSCNLCEENIDVQPWENIWSTLQNHPHFEETYAQSYDFAHPTISDPVESGDSSTTNDSVVDDLSEEINNIDLSQTNDLDLSQATQSKPEESSSGLNDFKFNFVVTYDQRVEEALYPDQLIIAARKKDNISEYTVQRCGAGRGVCLLCPCNLISRGRVPKINSFIIKNHAAGQRHLKYAATPLNVTALRQYHDFWRRQDPNFQAHQVYFIPEITTPDLLKCHLCNEYENYNHVLVHIREKSHKNRVLKIFYSPEGKSNEFYLLDMQVEIYDVKIKKEEKPKENEASKENKEGSSNGTNGAVAKASKCHFVKFVPEANGLNLPHRYKDHSKFFVNGADTVNCNLCKMKFNNHPVAIRSHIWNSQHRQLSGFNVPRYRFFCEICNSHIKDDVAWEDHFIKGPNKHDSMPPQRKAKVAEYECKTCLVVIFGDEISLSRHISTRGGKSGKVKDIKLPFAVKKLFKNKSFIEEEARRLQVEAARVLEYQDQMKECCEDLEQALSVIYPNCKAYPFGSRISGVGNNQSDLDVFMDTGDMYLGDRHQDSQSQEQFVKKAAKVMKSCKEDFSYVVSIPSARTPIVKLHHNYTNLDCDISFRHGLGVENTKFLRFCIDLQPIMQPFILLLKKWSEYCKLNEHITNYGLALMAVFFLQTGGYLLPVKTVRSYNPTQALIIDGWDTLNYTVPIEKMREFVKPYTASVKQLLRDFFFYFSKFDYANQVVCPLLGNTIPKLMFNEKPSESLPVEMKSYVQRIQTENGEQFRGLTPFCIQDPFDLSHNLTKACQHGTITKLKTLCTLTYEFFDTIE